MNNQRNWGTSKTANAAGLAGADSGLDEVIRHAPLSARRMFSDQANTFNCYSLKPFSKQRTHQSKTVFQELLQQRSLIPGFGIENIGLGQIAVLQFTQFTREVGII